MNTNVRDFDEVRRAFNQIGWFEWRAYTPTWTASGGTPAIGNGTLTGYYMKALGLCLVSITMTAGSTTTFGPGDFSFSVPFTASATVRNIGSTRIYDSSAGLFYVAVCSIEASGSTIQAVANGAGIVSNLVPMTWATSDVLDIQLLYATE